MRRHPVERRRGSVRSSVWRRRSARRKSRAKGRIRPVRRVATTGQARSITGPPTQLRVTRRRVGAHGCADHRTAAPRCGASRDQCRGHCGCFAGPRGFPAAGDNGSADYDTVQEERPAEWRCGRVGSPDFQRGGTDPLLHGAGRAHPMRGSAAAMSCARRPIDPDHRNE